MPIAILCHGRGCTSKTGFLPKLKAALSEHTETVAIDLYIRDLVRDIKVPVLIVHGTQDDDTPIGHSRMLSETLPNSELSR